MGTTIFNGVRSIHHFCYGRYQSAERLNWGNLRVLNHVRLEPGAARSPNFLGSMEVIILAEAGEIEIQCGDRKLRLANGGCAILTMGLGGDYGIANVQNTEAAYTEIWVNVSEAGALFSGTGNDNLRHAASISTSRSRVKFLALTPLSRAQASILTLADSELVDWRLEYPLAYVTVLDGQARIEGIWCETGDAIALNDESQIAIVAEGPCEILTIQLPV
ncbi:hypothetical protein [Sphingobium sp. BS19]|uniref:pirin family protein n=1 Tax=Sphingobium sp. BS19 TaxID=3018973 RepID=UPI00248F52B0|nr:hypothetical protein [Sphingobium sp. BS19]